jgi:hypothetical protein
VGVQRKGNNGGVSAEAELCWGRAAVGFQDQVSGVKEHPQGVCHGWDVLGNRNGAHDGVMHRFWSSPSLVIIAFLGSNLYARDVYCCWIIE